MRCLIIGANFTNRGAESMIDVAVDQLWRRRPGIEIIVASYAKAERREYGTNLVEGPSGPVPFEFIANSRSPLRLLRVILAWLLPESLRGRMLDGDPYLAAFSTVDFVVDISGFALSDQRSVARRFVYGVECLTAAVLVKPMFLLTQAFGPLKYPVSRLIARWSLPRAGLVIARDQESVEHIQGLNLSEIELQRCADMALLLPTLKALPAEGAEKPVLGIVPNVNLLTESERDGQPGEYVATLAAIANQGLSLGADVLFVCYESFPDRDVDDVWIARAAMREAGLGGTEIVEDANALELKAIVAGLDLLVGARYHSLVAAVATKTPFLAIGWAHKYEGLATEAGVPGAFIDGRSVSTERLLAAVKNAWLTRSETRHALGLALPQLLESASNAFDLLESQLPTKQSRPAT